jgi:DNA invertase Pin-like site-specific DNA recombinase
MAFIGYGRVSTHEQILELQLNKLWEKGCMKIFTDKMSGAKFEREQLEAALAYLREGDTLVVWKLDRLGRSLRHLIDTVMKLQERGIGFISLTENIDTTTPGGKLTSHIMGALAEFERDLIRERTMAGLQAARARGKKGGRKPKLTQQQIDLARRMYADKEHYTIKDILSSVRCSKSTLYAYLKQPTAKKQIESKVPVVEYLPEQKL